MDTLSALQKVIRKAEVINQTGGSILTDFNGSYLIEEKDKPAKTKTLKGECNSVEFDDKKTVLRVYRLIKFRLIKQRFILIKNIFSLKINEGNFRIIAASNTAIRDSSKAFKIDVEVIYSKPSIYTKDQ